MIAERLIDPRRAVELFAEIESQLFRYPAIDPEALRAKVRQVFGG
jgi:hypothetical protein